MAIDVKQNSAVVLLIDDVVLEDLVIERPRWWDCSRHTQAGCSEEDCVKEVVYQSRRHANTIQSMPYSVIGFMQACVSRSKLCSSEIGMK